MSNKNNNARKYQQSEKQAEKHWGKFWIGLICFVLVLAVLFGVTVWRTKGLKDWTFGFGTEHTETRDPADNDVNGEDKDPSDDELVNSGENKGILLKSRRLDATEYDEYGIEAQANTAYSVTATVNEDAVDKSVIGSVFWKNGSSAWATGKNINDYVTLNQTVEYGLDFTLTVKQAFGEPVMIKVASCMDSEVYGTAQVDYLRELISFTGGMGIEVQGSGHILLDGRKNVYRISPEWGVGTIDGVFSKMTLHFYLNQYTVDTLNARLRQNSNTSGYTVKSRLLITFDPEGDGFIIPMNAETFLDGTGNADYAKIIINNFMAEKGIVPGESYGSSAVQAGVINIICFLTYSFGEDYSVRKTYSDEKTTLFRKDNLTLMSTIDDINLNPDHIVALPNQTE